MPIQCVHCGGAVVDGICEDCGKPAAGKSLVTSATGGIDSGTGATASADGSAPTTGRTRGSTRFTVNYPTRTGGTGTTAHATAPGTRPSRRRAGVSTHTSTRRASLGGGLISLPDLPSQDPLQLLMATPEVPPHKRHCPHCDAAVNRTKGFCPACGTAYDFVPRLKAGDVVCDKYEIKGPVAFGGLGWIYLGWDTVLQRWVVLKGLLNADDEASAAAAVAERRYLAAVKHPKIVGIYDFVQQGAEGFIIMEYVGGQTVHSLRKQRGPLPVAEAIAYIMGIIPAFSYLHAQGLVYCDMKPDNLMLEGGDVKLIDMGAVRKINDPNGDIYATVGFAAPEASEDPIAVSDLYTLGRTLAVLIMDFRFSTDHEHSLPTPDEQPVLAENESLYRFLLRATHVDPDERFQTADEMGEQLFGVLREIVALKSGPKPADSKVFTGDRLVRAEVADLVARPDPMTLPSLRVDLQDKAANEVIRVLSLMNAEDQARELQVLVATYGDRAVEPRLRLAEVLILSPQLWPQERQALIEGALQALEDRDAFDWRPGWMRGLWLLTQGQGEPALHMFERCYFEMPGELAPRLGMGMAAELAGRPEQALPYYDRVGQVDPGYTTAHAGAARCLAASAHGPVDPAPPGQGIADAISMLKRVPLAHSMHTTAQLAVGELLLLHPSQVTAGNLVEADLALGAALLSGGAANQIAARLLALTAELAPRLPDPTHITLLGHPCNDTASLRLAAESQFRLAATQARDRSERVRWIGMANRVRPMTMF